MNYGIRVANESDLEGLCEIRNNKDLFINYFKHYMKKEVYLVIAVRNECILGFGVLKLKGLLPKLSDLYVNQNYRGNGIGSDLIRYKEKMQEIWVIPKYS
jgi:GNAT superfamily N-acetyltransferase